MKQNIFLVMIQQLIKKRLNCRLLCKCVHDINCLIYIKKSSYMYWNKINREKSNGTNAYFITFFFLLKRKKNTHCMWLGPTVRLLF